MSNKINSTVAETVEKQEVAGKVMLCQEEGNDP